MRRGENQSLFDRWTILILLAVAVWMIFAAGRYGIFDDEAFSLRRYEMPMGAMVRALWDGVEPDPPLYYILQNLSVRTFGIGPHGLRALSIIMFLAGLVAMRAAGRAWFGKRVGRVTMSLCALHPAHLFVGFAARWYSTMFLAVGVLLWATGRMVEDNKNPLPHPPGRAGFRSSDKATGSDNSYRASWQWIGWAVAAAAVCYVNYFGPVIVSLTWLVAVARSRDRGRWTAAILTTALLYAPWLPAFWRQVMSFPDFGGSAVSMLATAGRTLMALCAGNLASPTAWWVWGPMAAFSILFCRLTWRARLRVGPIALIVIGCFVAGVVSRTMIDKYVMTFSSVVCLLFAATLSPCHVDSGQATNRARIACLALLALGWLGCGVNLVTGKNWSSLRWLDPWESAVSQCVDHANRLPDSVIVASHPSATYYLRRLGRAAPLSPERAVPIIEKVENERCVTLEAAEFTDAPAWQRLRDRLNADYRLIGEDAYLRDEYAEWKDRLDPRFRHPQWRITVRLWSRE
jgi:hypothetical protein